MKRSSRTPPSSRHRTLYCAPPTLTTRDVVGEEALEELGRLRPGRLDLAHVGDVEDAGRLAHGEVLLAARPRTGPASPSRRTGRASRPRRRGGRRAGCGAGCSSSSQARPRAPRLPMPPPAAPAGRRVSGPRDRARGRPPPPPCGRRSRRPRSRPGSRAAPCSGGSGRAGRPLCRSGRCPTGGAGSGRSSGSAAAAGCRARRGSAGSSGRPGAGRPSGVSWRKENAGGYQGRAPPSSSAKTTSRRPRVDELAERRQRRGAVEHRDGRRAGRCGAAPASISAGGHVRLEDDQEHVGRVPVQEAADRPPAPGRTARPPARTACGRGRSRACRAGRRRRPGRRAGRPCAAPRGPIGHGDLVAGHALGPQVGPHPPRGRVAHPGVHVEQQGADAVVELTGDAVRAGWRTATPGSSAAA